MAVLSEADRQRVWRGIMRVWSNNRTAVSGFNKSELRAAVDALDSFMETNATAINNALPEPFKSSATQAQKALLLVGVVAMRFDLDFLKKVFGDVD